MKVVLVLIKKNESCSRKRVWAVLLNSVILPCVNVIAFYPTKALVPFQGSHSPHGYHFSSFVL